MNFKQALNHAHTSLKDKGIEDAALEGEILIRYILGIDRAYLYSHLDEEIDIYYKEALGRALERRQSGEPVAYITGHCEFYGLDFIVNKNVLIPRPESELLVEKAIDIVKSREITRIADIGTGSGAIAVSLAANLPGVTIYATDISEYALEVAAENCRNHGVINRIVLLRGDMLEALPGQFDLVIANLPYVETSILHKYGTLRFEPALALDGGKDGLESISIFCRQVYQVLTPNGYLLLEIGQGQTEKVKILLRKEFPEGVMEVCRDLAGIERVISLYLTSVTVF